MSTKSNDLVPVDRAAEEAGTAIAERVAVVVGRAEQRIDTQALLTAVASVAVADPDDVSCKLTVSRDGAVNFEFRTYRRAT